MNARKAKALRREAQLKTKGLPNKRYIIEAKGRGFMTGKTDSDGNPAIEYNPDAARLAGCTRSVYQALKKLAR